MNLLQRSLIGQHGSFSENGKRISVQPVSFLHEYSQALHSITVPKLREVDPGFDPNLVSKIQSFPGCSSTASS